MTTLLGALLGFISSLMPDVLKLFRQQQDLKHEIAILDRQIELQKLGFNERLQTTIIAQDQTLGKALYKTFKPSGIAWVDALSGTVRPVITYAFFILYAAVKYAQWRTLLQVSVDPSWSSALIHIWHTEDQALFAAVMSFWFGQRTLFKNR